MQYYLKKNGFDPFYEEDMTEINKSMPRHLKGRFRGEGWLGGEVVDAVLFDGLNFEQIEALVGGDVGNAQDGSLVVATKDGALKLRRGDVIYRRPSGKIVSMLWKLFLEAFTPVVPERGTP
jgi:hypothetical protein